ncbi:transcription initiation factor TFIID subunit 12b [Amborella trichopoda]|nr:transcription initiation factor TFIID subunit 12b [Amborella trichopoda]|eukprot:XP_006846365.3 transcription initiation factor TFIID subunit 12b [Amborella trichopoda]
MKILGPTAIGNGVGGIGSAARHLDPIAAQKWIPLWLGYGGSGLGSIGNGVGAIASGARPLVPWVASTMILVLLPLDALGLTLSNRGLVEARFTKKGYWWAEWAGQYAQALGQFGQGGQQVLGSLARSGQHIPMLPTQANQLTNIQNQLLAHQPRQKTALVSGSHFLPANSSGQPMPGLQNIGVMGSLGLNPRANGSLSYNQQRVTHAQMRQAHLAQHQPTSLTSSQKLSAPGLQRVPSLASMNHQLSALTQSGQPAMMQNSLSQTQLMNMKSLQSAISSPASPSYHHQLQRQQQNGMHQQLHQKQTMPMNQPQMVQQAQQMQQPGSQQLLIQHQQASQQSMQQQPSPRMAGCSIQKPTSLTGSQPSTPASGTTTGGSSSQGTEASNQVLGKRRIQDLVSQVDPQGKLDPEVEDILLEIADDFIDSVTTYACSLAKHRKSSTLESKDLLLHLERNWHLNIPGFSSEEQRNHRKPIANDAHRKRLEVIRNLMDSQSPDTAVGKDRDSMGQQAVNNLEVLAHQINAVQSEQMFSPAAGPQMVQKLTRF